MASKMVSIARSAASTLSWQRAPISREYQASDVQRARWRRIGRGFSVHWPDVDEDLSVAHLLGLSD